MLDAQWRSGALGCQSMAKVPDRFVDGGIKEREGRSVKAYWEIAKKRDARLTQAALAAELGVNASYITQLFNGSRPLSLQIARKFAEQLKCKLRDFSPRLADQEESGKRQVRWPFPTVEYKAIERLAPGELERLSGTIRAWLVDRGHEVDSENDLNIETPAKRKKNR